MLDNGAICLSGKPATLPPEPIEDDPWANVAEANNNPSGSADIKASLWSRKVPASFGIQCITLQFRISSELATLSLLQRQEG